MRNTSLAVVGFCLSIWCFGSPARGQDVKPADKFIKAGFAEKDITPEIGMEMPGNYGKVYGKSIHDPCKARAAVFDDGKKRVALVGIDTLIIRRQTAQAARKKIMEKCGIPADCVMIGASHSHSSGPSGFILPGEFDGALDIVKKLAYEQSSMADAKFLDKLINAIADAVTEANDKRVDAKISVGIGREERVSFNRRIRLKNGQTISHAGKGNPDIAEYAGPIDPGVGVIGAWDKNGKLIGTVVNFACHATTSPPGFSANWIYYMEKTIRAGMGVDVPVVFMQGDCGDITQVDNLSPYNEGTGEQQAIRVGSCVGAEAVKVLLLSTPGGDITVDAKSKVWNIGRRVPDPERVRRSFEIAQMTEKEAGHTEWIFAKEIVLLDAIIAMRPTEEVEVQAIQVGPAVFVSNPAELFVQFGLDLKKQSNFKFTFPVELANGCVGYVPTEEAMGPKGGGYETRLTSYSNLEVSAGRQFVDVGLELCKQMTPGAVPTPPKAPPWVAPWTYGNNRPEAK